LLAHSNGGDLLKSAAALPASSSNVALVADLFAVLWDEERPSSVRAQVPTAIARAAEGADEDLRAQCVREMVARLARPHEKPDVTAGILLALGDLVRVEDTPYDHAARAAVIAAVRNGDHASQCFALVSAGRIGASAEGNQHRVAALEMESLLIDALEHGRSGTDGFAAMGLGLLRDANGILDPERANAVLRRTLTQSGNASTQSASAIALGLRHDEQSREAIHALLFSGGGEEVRGLYALSLGLSGDCAAIRTLREMVTQAAHRPALLRESVIALGLLGDRDLTTALVNQMSTAPTQLAQNGYAQALALVGDSRSIVPLSALVSAPGTSLDARASAVRALGTVADLDPLPWNSSYALDAQYLAATETLTTPSGGGILDPR
jgi:HEAT repeat protein